MTPLDSIQPCYFLGAGIHTCLGETVQQNLAALQSALPPKTQLTCTLSDQSVTLPYHTLSHSLPDGSEQRLFGSLNQVITQALSEAGLQGNAIDEMGVFLGSSSFDISITESAFNTSLQHPGKKPCIPLLDPSFANIAQKTVQHFGIRGADFSFNTACTSSINALLAAKKQLDAGLIKHALIIGVELYNQVTALGFNGLGLLSKTAMKPFQDTMDGLMLGEGVSALVIGTTANQTQPFHLLGGHSQSDTYSMSASNPDGSSMATVMSGAMRASGTTAQHIGAIKSHATACQSNDAAEAAAMHAVFHCLPPICTLKPFIGHTLGACGLNELILFYKAIDSGYLIGTPSDLDQNPNSELNIPINDAFRPIEPSDFMLNYFGFGGNNTSVIISNKDRHH